MTYIKVGNKFSDGDFNHLKLFLQIIDRELSELCLQITDSADPDSDGLCDLGEYLIGYGFVAIQRYVASTYPQTTQNKTDIYRHGLKLCDDLFLMEVIHAGANYWKHEPEWLFSLETGYIDIDDMTAISVDRSGDMLSNVQKKTFDSITKLTPYADYTLSNLLSEIIKKISPAYPLSFSPLLPFIEQWRNQLDKG